MQPALFRGLLARQWHEPQILLDLYTTLKTPDTSNKLFELLYPKNGSFLQRFNDDDGLLE